MKIQMKGSKTAEILLYEDIGGWFGITAEAFVKEVKALGNVDTINLRINSNGGSVFDGLSIYNYLRAHKARIEVDIDGLAASIASIVAMAGDEVRIADNAWMMIHDPWVMAAGTAEDLRNTAEMMDGIRETLLDTYMKRASVGRDKVSAMMTSETWLNSSDASANGLVDKVTGSIQMAASLRKEWFKNAPKALTEKRIDSAHVKLMQARMNQSVLRHQN